MPNQRLRAAITAARLDRDSVAHALRVDMRTVERWEDGRVPHPRHRFAVAELLGQSEAYLWPELASQAAGGSTELLGTYPHRADIPIATWRDLLMGSKRQVDLLGFALLFLPEQHVDLVQALQQKCTAGCSVRIAVADPDCEAVRERDDEEGLGGRLPARIATALYYLHALVGTKGIELRLHSVPMYNSIFRFDDEMA